MTRLQRLTDAISAIEKNLENLKETLEELKSKSFTGICESNINEKLIKRDKVFLLKGFIDYVNLNVRHNTNFKEYEHGMFNHLREILDDKESGLKAIAHLWNCITNVEEHYVLYTIFPWQKDNTLKGTHDTTPVNIKEWLLENYQFEMVNDFLNNHAAFICKADLDY